MNAWLDAMTADPAPLSIDKVVKHKPADAVDTCWDATGNKIVEPASFDAANKCNAHLSRCTASRGSWRARR